MKREELDHREGRRVPGRLKRRIDTAEGRNSLSRAALRLTILFASALSCSAQSHDLRFLPLTGSTPALPALDHGSPNSIQLETDVVEVAIPAATLSQENWAAGRLDTEASGGALSFTRPYTGFVVQAAVPESQPPGLNANPGRPAMTTSALLTPIGYAQFETGFLYAAESADFSNRNAEEETMRLTVASRMQVILAGEPVAASKVGGQASAARGDTTAGAQVILMPGHVVKPTVSVSYFRLLREGNATNLDIGGFANSVLLMASADLGHFHVDSNGFLNETEGPIRRAQLGQTVAVTHPVTPKLSATVELRHFSQPLSGGDGLSALWACAYAVRPNLVFDTGLVRGFTGTSTQWQVASGVTYVLPRRIWGLSRTPAGQ
jgi:hypothetical protein